MSKPLCDICDSEYEPAGYGQTKCGTCGQEYVYDEAEHIALSDEQYELLRKHYRDSL